jgi:hypothetical protein
MRVRLLDPAAMGCRTVFQGRLFRSLRPDLGSYRMYIDGRWSNSEASEIIEVENPANEVQDAAVTSQVSSPRYIVELTSTGPLPVAPSTANPHRPARSGRQGKDRREYRLVPEPVDTEAIAEIRHLENHRFLFKREETETVNDVLVWSGNRAFLGLDIVSQHREGG